MPDSDIPPAIDAPIIVPDVPLGPMIEVLAPSENRPTSIAVYQGTVVWTTDPPTSVGPGQTRQLVPGNPIVTLSASEDHPGPIAVGMGITTVDAFWGQTSLLGKVRQIAVTGAPPLSSAAVNDVIYSLVLDGDSVFFGTRSTLYKKSVGNVATPVNLTGGFGNGVLAIAADAAGVVYAARTVQGTWVVQTIGRNGGTPVPLATGPDFPIRDIAIIGANVYWLDRTMVKKVSRTGGTEAIVKTFGSTDRPWAMVASQGKLYIATNQGVINPSGATGHIIELDPATGAEREIAKDQPEPSDVAVDASYIYWANRGVGTMPGQILRFPRP